MFLNSVSTLFKCIIVLLQLLDKSLSEEDPWGLAVRITTNGINHVLDLGIKKLEIEINKAKLPEIVHSVAGGQIRVFDLNINEFKSPRPSYNLQPPNSIFVGAHGGHLQISGRWELDAPWPIGHQFGALEVGTENVDVEVESDIYRSTTESGTPNFKITHCVVNIGNLNVNVHGGFIGALSSVFNGMIRGKIVAAVQENTCKLLRHMTQKSTDKIPSVYKINEFVSVDFGLTETPEINELYVQTKPRADFFLEKPRDLYEPLSAGAVPPEVPVNTSSMASVLVSEAAVNSLLKALSRMPNARVVVQDHSGNPGSPFRTTCPGYPPMCLGRFMRKLGQMHPNRTIQIAVTPNKAPSCRMSNGLLSVLGSVKIDLLALSHEDSSNNRGAQASYDFVMDISRIKLSQKGNIKIQDVRVSHFDGRMSDAKNGMLDEDDHRRFLKLAKPVMEVFVNDFLVENRISIPEAFPAKFRNTDIRFLNGAMLIDTDLDLEKVLDLQIVKS